MVVTELGILMLVRLEQFAKALFPILVTELGIDVFWHPMMRVLVVFSMMALQLFRESNVGLPSLTLRLVRLVQP